LATARQDELRETSRTSCVVCCGRTRLLHPSPSAWRPPSPLANALLKDPIKIGSVVTLAQIRVLVPEAWPESETSDEAEP
jgi:hypothetical protein